LRSQYVIVQQTSELLKIHREGLSRQARSEFQSRYRSLPIEQTGFSGAANGVSRCTASRRGLLAEHGRIRELPSRASSSSLDCHCITRERNDENVSHWIFGGIASENVVLGVVLVGLWLH